MMRKIFRHVLAILCSVGFFAVVALALYCSWIIPRGSTAADLGGPLNYVIIPLAGALVGLVVSLFFFLPLATLADRFGFRRWLWTVAIVTGVLTVTVILASVYLGPLEGDHHGWSGSLLFLVGSSVVLYIVGGFFVYLCGIGVCRRLFP